jgi:hypothetical protein
MYFATGHCSFFTLCYPNALGGGLADELNECHSKSFILSNTLTQYTFVIIIGTVHATVVFLHR